MLSTVPAPAPIRGVIFDFHATLVDVDTQDPGAWIRSAVQHLEDQGRPVKPLSPGEITGLGRHLDVIWEHASTFDPDSERDLDRARHREVFTEAVNLYPGGVDPDLIDGLYAVMADQWAPFADTLPVLRELRARGLPVAVLSNIGLDIREHLAHHGLAGFVDAVVLSYEVGAVKPAPEIFSRALELIDRPAGETLMVGDSWRHDAGAAGLGIRTLILPRTRGPVHGLGAVLDLVGTGSARSQPDQSDPKALSNPV